MLSQLKGPLMVMKFYPYILIRPLLPYAPFKKMIVTFCVLQYHEVKPLQQGHTSNPVKRD